MLNRKNSSLGFTLIELVVVMGILSLILGATVTLINPAKQIDKAKLAKKESDLEQIKTAMDLYYDDNKCYPDSLAFGNKWSSESTVYMSKVPSSSDPGEPYSYEASGGCPQWYVIFAKVSQWNSKTSAKCPLSSIGSCMPPDDSDNHICVYGGIVNCNYVSTNLLSD